MPLYSWFSNFLKIPDILKVMAQLYPFALVRKMVRHDFFTDNLKLLQPLHDWWNNAYPLPTPPKANTAMENQHFQ